MKLVAKTIAGLENVLAGELRSIGAEGIEILNRAVAFEGDLKMVYKANYCCRTALRILTPLTSFQIADEDDLYHNIFNYPWEEVMEVTQTLAVDAVVSDSDLTHSHYLALRTKDAIADRFRREYNGRRPSVDTDNPQFRINVHINGNTCDLSLDSSGQSLHKRGYRVSNAEAPMSEVLAAGLILLSGWDKKCNFIDPMCGSGTLVIEAALYANNIPPGQYRKDFGFMYWKNFNAGLWEEVKAEAIEEQEEFDFQIIGCDISPKNLGSARANVKSAKLHKDIQLHVTPFAAFQPPAGEPGIVVMNPPYGERIRTNDIIGLYRSIGDTLKAGYAGYNAWIISSDRTAMKFIGLRTSARYSVWNGPLECLFAGYDLYRGSKKEFTPYERDEHTANRPAGGYRKSGTRESEEKRPPFRDDKRSPGPAGRRSFTSSPDRKEQRDRKPPKSPGQRNEFLGDGLED